MADSVLVVGDKLHIMTRRLFADDVHPHFVGEISAVTGRSSEPRVIRSYLTRDRTRMSGIPRLAPGCSHSPMPATSST